MKSSTSAFRYHKLILCKTALFTLLSFATALLASAQQPATPIAPAPRAVLVPPQTPPPTTQPASFLAWEADTKDYNAKEGELTATFSYYVTNVSSEVVIFRELKPSCGCTAAKLPEQPWKMMPGTNGSIMATMDFRGKTGRITKTLTVESSAGSKVLTLSVNIPTAPAPTAPAPANNSLTEPPKVVSSK